MTKRGVLLLWIAAISGWAAWSTERYRADERVRIATRISALPPYTPSCDQRQNDEPGEPDPNAPVGGGRFGY